MEKFRKSLPYLWLFLASLTTLALLSKSSPFYPLNDWVDANCFLSTGKAVLSGQVLYRDIYEQKGPLLYFLHAVAALISDGSFLGVFFLEVLSLTGLACTGYILSGKRPAMLFVIPGLLMLTCSTVSFSSGDSAEELALPFLAFALYTGLSTAMPSRKQAFFVGLTAGVLLWIKYTLCGFYLAYALYILVRGTVQKRFRDTFQAALAFLAGVLAVSLPVILCFAVQNALPDLFESYFVNNITAYSPSAGGKGRSEPTGFWVTVGNFAAQNPYFTVMVLLGLISCFIEDLRKGFFLLVTFCISLIFISLGTRPYPYYAFILAVFTLPAYRPVSQLLSRLSLRWAVPSALAFSLAMGCLGFSTSLNTYLFLAPKEDMPQFRFASQMAGTENATLLNYGFLDGGFYTAASITPSTRFFCQLNISLPEMRSEMKRYISEGATDYVVTRGKPLDSPVYELIDQSSYVYQSNAESPRPFTYYLYRKKQLP